MLDDPETARLMADEADPDKKWTPAPSDWTMLHELTAEVRDLLGEACALLADHPVAVKQRHKPPAQFPRPRTAFDREMARRRQEAEEAYDRRLDDFVTEAKANWRREQERLQRDGLGVEQQEVRAAGGVGEASTGDAGG